LLPQGLPSAVSPLKTHFHEKFKKQTIVVQLSQKPWTGMLESAKFFSS